MFKGIERLPEEELKDRQATVREHLQKFAPSASGLLIFSRINQYYLTGTLPVGVLWLPVEGEPLLMLRKGEVRAVLEASATSICSFKSYSELPDLAADFGVPFGSSGSVVAVEQTGLSWDMGVKLSKRLKDFTLLPADAALTKSRSVKSELELERMLKAGAMHGAATEKLLPKCLGEGRWQGMSERDVSIMLWDIFFSLGHEGIMRMSAPGEEIFLGHITAGENGNYPTYYNGPLGNKGGHPASPYMGNASSKLEKNSFLAVDAGFSLQGYNTDKTQIYFSGKEKDIPSEARRAQDLALKIQDEIAARLVPGAIPEELYKHSLKMAQNAGLSDAYMGIGGNKVPFLGHSIGLCIDEWPVLANGFTSPLSENMTFALEPKFGLAGIAMLGVENTFVVTSKGGINITGADGDIICLE